MCVIDVDEYCEVWEESIVKARKPHRCSCCRAEIRPGEKYLKHWSIFQGDPQPGTLCLACNSDREIFAAAHQGVMAHPWGFDEMLCNCIADGDEESEKQWKPMLERIRGRRI